MDPSAARLSSRVMWLPRVSGDGPRPFELEVMDDSVAPRERGWTPDADRGPAVMTGCPA